MLLKGTPYVEVVCGVCLTPIGQVLRVWAMFDFFAICLTMVPHWKYREHLDIMTADNCVEQFRRLLYAIRIQIHDTGAVVFTPHHGIQHHQHVLFA